MMLVDAALGTVKKNVLCVQDLLKQSVLRRERQGGTRTRSPDLYSHHPTRSYNGTLREKCHEAADLVSRSEDLTFEYEAV